MYRTIDTATWDDPWVTDLEPLDKLLFFYLLTNRRSTACGAFEITLKAMAFETGMSAQQVKAALPRLQPKIVWWPEHQVIFVRNFYKHQRAQSNKDNFRAAAQKKLEDFHIEVQQEVWACYPELCTSDDGLPTYIKAEVSHPHPIPMGPPSLGDKETVTVTVNATETVTEVPREKVDFDSIFETIWQRYPAREGSAKIGKAETKAMVKALGPSAWPDVLKAVINYSQAGRLPVDPIRFFKSRDFPNGLWREFVNGGTQNGANRQGNSGLEIAPGPRPTRSPGLKELLDQRASASKAG